METVKLIDDLQNRYNQFFEEMNINPDSGILSEKNKRFNGCPYVGDNYCRTRPRILFVPLDCGADELKEKNTYLRLRGDDSRESRVNAIKLDEYRSHLAGLYSTTLFLLKDVLGYQQAWDELWANKQYKMKKAIHMASQSLPTDLFSHISYVNRFNFVSLNREKRAGNKDRVWNNETKELELLYDVIDLFSPDILVFQGKAGLNRINTKMLKEKFKTVYTLYHPSCWQKGADKLEYIVNSISTFKLPPPYSQVVE